MIDDPEHTTEDPPLSPQEVAAQWRHALAEQREANARWTTFLAAYGQNSPGFEERSQAHADDALNADAALIELPAPDLAALADKIEVVWSYCGIIDEMHAAILVDARRLANEQAWPWSAATPAE